MSLRDGLPCVPLLLISAPLGLSRPLAARNTCALIASAYLAREAETGSFFRLFFGYFLTFNLTFQLFYFKFASVFASSHKTVFLHCFSSGGIREIVG